MTIGELGTMMMNICDDAHELGLSDDEIQNLQIIDEMSTLIASQYVAVQITLQLKRMSNNQLIITKK